MDMARIVLIDDEAAVLQSIGIVLRSEGHTVVPINDSSKAEDVIKGGNYDLVITDIRMSPVDGMQILKLVHDSQPSKPIIVISAFGSDATVDQCAQLGCAAYIKKPFRIQEVLNAVDTALGKK